MEFLLVALLLLVLPIIVWRVLVGGRVLPRDDDDTLVLSFDSVVPPPEPEGNF